MTINGVSRLFFFLMCLLLLSGCAASSVPPEVWKHPQVAFGDYQALHIRPVFNATGRPLDDTVLTKLTDYLEEQLSTRGLDVSSAPEEISGMLAVHSKLVVYMPYEQLNVFKSWLRPVWAKIRCTVHAELVDKSTTRIVAEITVTRENLAGAVIGGPNVTSDWILRDTATALAAEIVKLMAQ